MNLKQNISVKKVLKDVRVKKRVFSTIISISYEVHTR